MNVWTPPQTPQHSPGPIDASSKPPVGAVISLLAGPIDISRGVPISVFRKGGRGEKRIQQICRQIERLDVQLQGHKAPDVDAAGLVPDGEMRPTVIEFTRQRKSFVFVLRSEGNH